MTDLSAERRRRLTHRAAPALAGLAVVAAAAGMMVGAGVSSAEERTARSFTEAWERQDYRAMYRLLDDASRRAYSAREFRRAYRNAAATATVRRVAAGDPRGEHDEFLFAPLDPVRDVVDAFPKEQGERRFHEDRQS